MKNIPRLYIIAENTAAPTRKINVGFPDGSLALAYVSDEPFDYKANIAHLLHYRGDTHLYSRDKVCTLASQQRGPEFESWIISARFCM